MITPEEKWRKLSDKAYIRKNGSQFIEVVIAEQTSKEPIVKVKGMRKSIPYTEWEAQVRDPISPASYYFQMAGYRDVKITPFFKWHVYLAYYHRGVNIHVPSIKYWSDITGFNALEKERPMMTFFGDYPNLSLAKKIADAGVLGLYNFSRGRNMVGHFL